MKALLSFDTYLRLNLLFLFAAGLFFWCSMGALLPTLPLYLEEVGQSKQQIGLVMGGFAIGLLLFRPMLGKLADQRGRKIPLLIGTIVGAIAPFGYLAFTSIPLLLLVRIFDGVSVAAFTTGYSALITDLAPPAQRGEIIGYMSLATPIGLAIGPALGGYLQATAGYAPLFLLAAELAFVGVLATLQLNNPPVESLTSVANQKSKFWQILWRKEVRIPTLVMLLFGLGLGTVHTFVGLFIKSTKVDFNVGLFFTAAAIASFCIRLFAGKLSDRVGRGLFITGGIMAYTVSLLLLWSANNQMAFLLAAMAEGAGGGTLISMMITMMADRSQPEERGKIFALCIAGLDLGIAIAAPFLGSVAQQVGYRNMFLYCAGLTMLAVFIFLTQSSRGLTNSVRFALGRGEDAYKNTR